MGFTPHSLTGQAEEASPSLETALRWDRVIVGSGLGGITILSWLYLISMARNIHLADFSRNMLMPHPPVRASHDLAMLCAMWAVMMVAMMVPAVTPTALLFSRFNRSRHRERAPYRETWGFLGGYLVLWTLCSLLAGVAQWASHSSGLISEGMVSTSNVLGGALLLGAGVYQWTPLKNACLKHCRSPLAFLMTRWREGTAGAFRMGLEHGAYCAGCCWFMMLLLFVAGVMNFLWMGAITALVLVEKISPAGPWAARMSGALFAGWGAWMLGLVLFGK
jgi:predicted metal-binding membrane protein